jgi:hypothetical protein
VDVDNDGWLDIVTATTNSDDAPHHIGHPRVYRNLGEIDGVWQGFKFEMARIPTMLSAAGVAGKQPRFCALAVGDVTGDGYADLYFGDYDSSGAGGSAEPPANDFNNKLLANCGPTAPGVFIDTLTNRMSANPGLMSAFNGAAAIADMNGDGTPDVIKQTALNSPLHVAIQYNDPNNVGYFPDSLYKIVNVQAPYFASVGDLNNDGKLDIVVTDDNPDHYHLNQGNAANGTANFSNHVFSFVAGSDDGFGEESVIADLNNDKFNDVLITDVHVDIGGCTRRMHIYRNLGNVPNVTLQEAQPLIIPANQTTGTHDVAVFNIDGDGWKDLVIGRCAGTSVWMNVPPAIPCIADIAPMGQLDGVINVNDLLAVIFAWGPAGGPADIAGPSGTPDGVVDVNDLLVVINAWGACP